MGVITDARHFVPEEDESEELLAKAAWLKKSASIHSSSGNKLNSISERMHANERNRGDEQLYEENININKNTLTLYMQGVEAAAKKMNTTDKQKQTDRR